MIHILHINAWNMEHTEIRDLLCICGM